MALVETRPGTLSPCLSPGSYDPSQSSSWLKTSKSDPEVPRGTNLEPSSRKFHRIASNSRLGGLHIQATETLTAVDDIGTRAPVPEDQTKPKDSQISPPHISVDCFDVTIQDAHDAPAPETKGAFHKWMKTLHRRATERSSGVAIDGSASPDWSHSETKDSTTGRFRQRLRHQKSSSGSSFGFVSAVQSASISLASASAVTRSRRNTNRSHCQSRTDHSSHASIHGPRISEDSIATERQTATDAAAAQRALQRRKILEELLNTEEGYIGDVRFLMNVYITILASLPTLPMRLRSSINRNLTEIIELHEELLGELHRVIPNSEYTQLDMSSPLSKQTSHGHGHRRWWSLDAVPEHQGDITWLQDIPGMVSDPQIAAEVAKIFSKKMNRFFIYKEYGAKYEMMIKDVASAHRTMPQWETYQRGLEALASTLGSIKSNDDKSRKKSLTIGDLLVKPIQRVCKYPLLFAELLKYTPVLDCPNSHMEVESALMRLREATAEINRATNDDHMKATLERTWLLQDRLVFPKRRIDADSKNQVRSFGHVQLCGSLYVCWQTKDGVDGRYMICLLYRDILCLASAGKVDPIYTINACINLHRAKVEEVDNGRGIQCHTVPFSWKLVFESDHQLYELIMTACTAREECEWRTRLCQPAGHVFEERDSPSYSSLFLDIKSLGTLFGKPGTMARRISIHRATTVGPKSPLCQVILKNTSVTREGVSRTPSPISINRSQSVLVTSSRVPILAPPRSERTRLETLLADVWSRDVLPFPGMTSLARSEHLVRSSASSVMRKLSVASITGSFSKKTGNPSQKAHDNDDTGPPTGDCDGLASKSSEDIDESKKSSASSTGRIRKRPKTQETSEEPSYPFTAGSLLFELTETSSTGRVADGGRRSTPAPKESRKPTPAPNSLRVISPPSSEKSTSSWAEKENACPQDADHKNRGNARRWPRVGTGTKNTTSKAQGFMSLFR